MEGGSGAKWVAVTCWGGTGNKFQRVSEAMKVMDDPRTRLAAKRAAAAKMVKKEEEEAKKASSSSSSTPNKEDDGPPS